MADDDRRLVLDGKRVLHSCLERLDIVSVCLLHMPAEGTELRRHIAERADRVDRAIDLKAIEVDEDAEVSELPVGSKHRCLPVLALLELAVAGEREDMAKRGALLLGVKPEAKGSARCDRHALAERSCADLDARAELRIGMSLQDASKLPDREHLVIRNPAKLVDDAVKGRGCVALRKDEEVAAVPLRVLRVIVHEAREIEDREDIRCRERSSRMSRPGLGQHLYDIVASSAAPCSRIPSS